MEKGIKVEDLISTEEYRKLQELFGGERIYISKKNTKDEVRTLYDKGYNIVRIAGCLQITKSQVYRHLKK